MSLWGIVVASVLRCKLIVANISVGSAGVYIYVVIVLISGVWWFGGVICTCIIVFSKDILLSNERSVAALWFML